MLHVFNVASPTEYLLQVSLLRLPCPNAASGPCPRPRSISSESRGQGVVMPGMVALALQDNVNDLLMPAEPDQQEPDQQDRLSI